MARNQTIVRYDNELNKISFTGFNDRELSLFFAIISKVKYQRDNQIIIKFDTLQDLTDNERNESARQLAERLIVMGRKLLKLDASFITNDSYVVFSLFEEFSANWKNEELTVKVSPRFVYLFNELSENWTRFELAEFVSLRGKHAKNLYRLLKQWRTAGHYSVPLKEFKRLLNVESYATEDLSKRVIRPAVSKVAQLSGFHDLRYSYSYAKKKKPIRIIFSWTPINPDIIKENHND